MTDEEFQRIKETEKKHLRAKKRLRRALKAQPGDYFLAPLRALKQRNEVQNVVQRMKQGAARLLDETESLVDSLRHNVAENEARFDLAFDDEVMKDEDLHAAEEELREERAEALVRRMKADEEASPRPRPSAEEADETSDAAPELDGPDKTIGRMGDLRTDDA
ncbi:MAG: hypothetical protein ABEL51_12075 [Salinibacter sp.]